MCWPGAFSNNRISPKFTNESKEEENSIDEIEENEDIGFTKEQAREKFLSNYNKNYDEDELQ